MGVVPVDARVVVRTLAAGTSAAVEVVADLVKTAAGSVTRSIQSEDG